MIYGKTVVVVLPAYNAENTLERVYREIPLETVDHVILVDDASGDRTARLSERLGIQTIVHPRNLGYGGNQKTCFQAALAQGADVVVTLHPDYQYPPKIIPALAGLVASGEYDLALGSRFLEGKARQGGMPFYKYVANRFLTTVQNMFLSANLSEFHTGFRAFSRQVLEGLPLGENSDNFLFDNQMLAQAIYFGFTVGEVPGPCRYFPEASSINFSRSLRYGVGVLGTSLQFFLQKKGWGEFSIFSPSGRRIRPFLPSSRAYFQHLNQERE